MGYWLMKTEPGEFSFEDLVRDGRTVWDGVRNFQARNNMKAMKQGDQVLIYHSVTEKALAGIARVSREFYPDPTDNPKGDWVVVDLEPVKALQRKISLAEIKANPALAEMPLIRQSRLSVMPLDKITFDYLIDLSGQKPHTP
ncbi:EVE domain-containing protein [Vampirovibrio chlorellavorus]|uniref:EVE domain-containing protein n=1 Tax=Vampirovibrio chlorellavorus TaxID=758823 RepID=UPI0026F1231B|nr:EVE domain-containing protein [Vampirovibrio chlorellavorus]